MDFDDHYPDTPEDKDTSEPLGLKFGMTLLCAIVLAIALISFIKIGYDAMILRQRTHLMIKIGLATMIYFYGLGLAALAVHRQHNNWIPVILRIYGWLSIALGSSCYIGLIFIRLHKQLYTVTGFFGYVIVLLVMPLAALGFHLITKKYNIRPYAIPLVIGSVLHLGDFMYRAIFYPQPDLKYIAMDLGIFMEMLLLSIFILTRAIPAPQTDEDTSENEEDA